MTRVKRRPKKANAAAAPAAAPVAPADAAPKKARPEDFLLPFLGKRPDAYFAERMGRAIVTVAAIRGQAGLPSYGERCRARLPITTSDVEIDKAIAAYKAARKKQPKRVGRWPEEEV